MKKFYLFPLVIFAAIMSGNVAFALEPDNAHPPVTSLPADGDEQNPKDVDVAAMLDEMGIPTEVDEKALEEKYPGVNIKMGEQELIFTFEGQGEQPYTLLIFDNFGNHLISYLNIEDGHVQVEREVLRDNTNFTYRLTGNGDTYAGRFTLAELMTAAVE